jgi:hypothetical protein
MTYCFDLDGTLCSNTNGKYDLAIPFLDRIDVVNKLYDEGNTILIDTARGSTTKIDWVDLTKKQLMDWNVKHHELRVGVKFTADLYIDDKSINETFFKNI